MVFPDYENSILALPNGVLARFGAPAHGPTLPALDEDLTAFAKIPQLYVYGDFMSEDYKVVHSWADSIRKTAPAWYAKLNELHADHTWMNLPAMGIKGNSHMLMMDDNNDQIANMINDWLVKKVPCGSK